MRNFKNSLKEGDDKQLRQYKAMECKTIDDLS
jgi:hypothetical protein